MKNKKIKHYYIFTHQTESDRSSAQPKNLENRSKKCCLTHKTMNNTTLVAISGEMVLLSRKRRMADAKKAATVPLCAVGSITCTLLARQSAPRSRFEQRYMYTYFFSRQFILLHFRAPELRYALHGQSLVLACWDDVTQVERRSSSQREVGFFVVVAVVVEIYFVSFRCDVCVGLGAHRDLHACFTLSHSLYLSTWCSRYVKSWYQINCFSNTVGCLDGEHGLDELWYKRMCSKPKLDPIIHFLLYEVNPTQFQPDI